MSSVVLWTRDAGKLFSRRIIESHGGRLCGDLERALWCHLFILDPVSIGAHSGRGPSC